MENKEGFSFTYSAAQQQEVEHIRQTYLPREIDKMEQLNVTDCLECGSCAFVCPGKLPLVDGCRMGKKLLKEAAKK